MTLDWSTILAFDSIEEYDGKHGFFGNSVCRFILDENIFGCQIIDTKNFVTFYIMKVALCSVNLQFQFFVIQFLIVFIFTYLLSFSLVQTSIHIYILYFLLRIWKCPYIFYVFKLPLNFFFLITLLIMSCCFLQFSHIFKVLVYLHDPLQVSDWCAILIKLIEGKPKKD